MDDIRKQTNKQLNDFVQHFNLTTINTIEVRLKFD